MATTHDIQELKAQFDERIAHLRDSFGVVETGVNDLSNFTHEFAFSSLEEHQQDDNNVQQAGKDIHDHTETFIGQAQAIAHHGMSSALTDAQHAVTDAQAKLDQHIQQHADAHHGLADATQAFAGNVEHVTGEAEQSRTDYLNHVHQMHDTLGGLADKLFGSADQLHQSVQDKQTQLLDQAVQGFHTVLDGHLQSHIPQGLEQAGQTIVQNIQGLASHATTAAENAAHEMQTMIHDLIDFATHEVQEKIQQKGEKLMSDAVASLTAHITEAVVVTTTGVTITAALGEILPFAIPANIALDAIRPAIKFLKTLEDIF